MANTVSAYFQLSGGKDGFPRGGIEKLKKRIVSLNLSSRTFNTGAFARVQSIIVSTRAPAKFKNQLQACVQVYRMRVNILGNGTTGRKHTAHQGRPNGRLGQ